MFRLAFDWRYLSKQFRNVILANAITVQTLFGSLSPLYPLQGLAGIDEKKVGNAKGMSKKISSKDSSGGVQRKEARYAVKTEASVLFNKSTAFGLFKHRTVYSGTIIDISLTGIRAEYKTTTVWSGDFNKMSIVTADNNFSINNIPCKIISDRKVRYLQDGTYLRRCGIKFGKLSEYHKLQLSYFIQTYTIVSDNQKSWHIEFA